MDLTEYVRKPFVVNAIKITEENIEELAQFVGTLSTMENGDKFIKVDRTKVPTVNRVFPGFWLTKMGENVRCYTGRTFEAQFIPMDDATKGWVEFLNKDRSTV